MLRIANKVISTYCRTGRLSLYDNKVKALFNLKGGLKNELLLNLIFPDYPDGNGGEKGNADENGAKEKETANAISQSGCSYTPVLVHRLTAKTNTVIYKVNRRELYCAVELPLSDYKLYGKQLAAR